MEKYNAESLNYLKKIMIISTFGGLLFGYDTGVVNGALPYMSAPDQLNLTPLHEGMVASSLVLGATAGALCGGKLSDICGRKKTIFLLSILFFVTTLGCSLSPSFEVIVVFRFLLGLAVGGASVTVPAYLAEVSPSEKRGRMVTQNELMIVTGQFLAFVCNALIAVLLAGDPHLWRYMLAIAALPAIVLFFGMMKLPESPRWLITKGRISEALEIFKKIRSTEALAISELNEVQDAIMSEQHKKSVSLKELNTPWIRRIILIGMALAAFSQLTGVNSIMYYGTQILSQAGFSMQAALIANTLNGLTSVAAVCTGIYLMTKIRRRTMLLAGFCGTTTALLLITISSLLLGDSPYLPYIVLSLTIMFLAFIQSCIGPILWLILSEIIPLKIRGIGMGICVFAHWIMCFLVSLIFPMLLDSLGLNFTFCIFVVSGLIAVIFTILYVPETKGKTLEQIEAGFRHYDRKEMNAVGTN